jgi:hypothetical protein
MQGCRLPVEVSGIYMTVCRSARRGAPKGGSGASKKRQLKVVNNRKYSTGSSVVEDYGELATVSN